MGQKVNPHGLRVGVIKGWDAVWYAQKKDFSKILIEDYKIREFIKKKYYAFGISRVTIERAQGKCIINIFTSKPGMIIGQKGAGIELLKKELLKFISKDVTINVNILEIKQPDKDATLVAESVAMQLEKRSSFRRTMKQAMSRVMRSGAKGVKIMVSGRLDGAEIARSEHYHEGSIPLQTLRADIDYGVANAHTTFGVIGVKVWIYKGEILGKNTGTNTNFKEQSHSKFDRNRSDNERTNVRDKVPSDVKRSGLQTKQRENQDNKQNIKVQVKPQTSDKDTADVVASKEQAVQKKDTVKTTSKDSGKGVADVVASKEQAVQKKDTVKTASKDGDKGAIDVAASKEQAVQKKDTVKTVSKDSDKGVADVVTSKEQAVQKKEAVKTASKVQVKEKKEPVKKEMVKKDKETKPK
jgi:small subunit ribosomal protein S3